MLANEEKTYIVGIDGDYYPFHLLTKMEVQLGLMLSPSNG